MTPLLEVGLVLTFTALPAAMLEEAHRVEGAQARVLWPPASPSNIRRSPRRKGL
jgi:hypothetical protein